jgi:3-deoxy-manno-octulosonate cytidylyltransferase (CMP-KDO synthetase)
MSNHEREGLFLLNNGAYPFMKKIIAFIPSRYESTRFPGKPLVLIAGKPMIQHVYEEAKACPEISEVFVATDDERIAQCVRVFGGLTVMTGRDHASGTDRIAEAASFVDLGDEDLVVNIQGDQPTFQHPCLPYLIRPLAEDVSLPMSTLVFKITDDHEARDIKNVKTVSDKQGFALFFSRSPIPYYRDSRSENIYYKHLGFYAYRRGFLKTFARLPLGEWENAEKLEQLRALEYGYKIKVVESPFDSYEVDTPSDVKIAEKILLQRASHKG